MLAWLLRFVLADSRTSSGFRLALQTGTEETRSGASARDPRRRARTVRMHCFTILRGMSMTMTAAGRKLMGAACLLALAALAGCGNDAGTSPGGDGGASAVRIVVPCASDR